MKPKLRSLLLAASSLLATSSLPAATLTWDANAATAGQTDGAGAWLDANQWWNPLTSSNATWADNDNAIIGNGGGTGTMNISLAAPGTTVGSLNFNRFVGTYTLGTAAQPLTINSGITSNHNNMTGATTVTNNAITVLSNVILGGAQTWRNNAYNPLGKTDNSSLSVQGGLDLNGHALTIDGIGTTNLGQVTGNIITGGGGIIKNGTGTLNLGGIGGSPINTYTGGTTINGGLVRFNAADTPGTSGSFGAGGITINNGIIEGYFGGTLARSLGSGTSNVQILGGTSGFSGQGGTGTTFTIGTSGSNLQFGSTNFFPTGGVFVLQSANVNTNGKLTLNNGIDLNGANRQIASLGGDSTGGATVTGAITDSAASGAGLTKSGAGNLILTNAGNTYTGATNINGAWWYNNSGANVYSGWLSLSGSGTLNSTNALNLNGGTLRLVNTAQVDRFTDGSAIAVAGGGGISYENTVGGNIYTETVGALTMSSGTTAITLLGDFAAAAGSQKLTLGNLTQNGTSTVFVSAGNAATTAPSADKNMIQVTSKSGLGAGQGTAATIIGPWATTGGSATLQTDYAVYDASGFVVPAAITSSTSGSWTDSTKAYSLNTGSLETLAADASAEALQFYGAASELALGGFKLQTNGLLFSGSNAKTISGGTLTTPSGGGNLYITTGRTGDLSTLTTTAAITDNSGAVNLVKSGAGRLILQGNNTYSGDTVVNGGTLLVGIVANTPGTPASLGSLSGGTYTYAGNIALNGGSTLQFRSTVNQTLSGIISGNGNLIIQGSGTKILSGNNTYTGSTTVGPQAASVGGAVLSVSSLNSVFTDVGLGTVHSANSSLGAPTTVETGMITIGTGIQSPATLRYTGTGETTDRIVRFAFNSTSLYTVENTGSGLLKFVSTPVSNGTITGSITLGGNGNGEFTGGLPFNFTNFTKSGDGTWTLGGPLSHANGTATTTINAGKLILNGAKTGAGAVNVNGTSTLGGTGTINGTVTVAAGANLTPGNSAGTLTFLGDLNISAMTGGAGVINMELGPIAASDKIVAGTVNIGTLEFDDFNFTALGGLQDGTYTLVQSGGLSGSLGGSVSGSVGGGNGTLQISDGGTGNNIELVVTGIGGGPTGYAAWQAVNPGATADRGADHDGDGVDNGTEFFLGGTVNTTGYTTPLPGVDNTGGVLSVTWTKGAGYTGTYDTDFWVETSDSLAGPWNKEAPLPDVDITDTAGSVKYTFPSPLGTRKFARLVVVGP